ncbi:MFS transporter [Streptosporangium sp. NPDC006013]|uniref:MFS transporter n=1 Tax=Streptosporangium sp. NPDC006013 TaxID=3155596 RepID=UPI0033A47366
MRKFARVWLGLTFSTVGSRAVSVAYPLLALALTGSPVQAGWTSFALTFPVLIFYIPAGVLADRVNPRSLMLLTETLRGLAVFSVFLALALDWPSLPHLLVAAFLEGTLWVVYSLAETALISSLVPRDEVSVAMARSETISHVAVLAGRPLGGWLFGIMQVASFAVNSALFFLALLSPLSVAGGGRGRRPRSHTIREIAGGLVDGLRSLAGRHLLREIADGFNELARHPFLRKAMALTMVTNLMVNALIMIFIAGSANLPSYEVGLVLAAGGMGGVAGSSLAPYLKLKPRTSMLFAQLWIWVLALLIAAYGAGPIFFGLAILLTGCTGALSNVAIRTFEVDTVDKGKLGRVMSVHRLVTYSAVCVAAPLGGTLVAVAGVRTAAVILAGLMFCVALVVTLVALLNLHRRLGLAGTAREVRATGAHAATRALTTGRPTEPLRQRDGQGGWAPSPSPPSGPDRPPPRRRRPEPRSGRHTAAPDRDLPPRSAQP